MEKTFKMLALSCVRDAARCDISNWRPAVNASGLLCVSASKLFFYFFKKWQKNRPPLSLSVRWSLITRGEWSVSPRNTGLHLSLGKKKKKKVCQRQHRGTWTVRVQSQKNSQGLGWQLCYHGAHEYRQPSPVIVTHTRQLTRKKEALHFLTVHLPRIPMFSAVQTHLFPKCHNVIIYICCHLNGSCYIHCDL